MLGYIHPNFIGQGGGAHREAEACGQGIQLLRVNSFLDRREAGGQGKATPQLLTERLPIPALALGGGALFTRGSTSGNSVAPEGSSEMNKLPASFAPTTVTLSTKEKLWLRLHYCHRAGLL